MWNRHSLPRPFAPALLFLLLLVAPQFVLAQGNVGFASLGTSDKPQSKLWHNDGYWWSVVNNIQKLSIYQLDTTTWTKKLDLQAALSPGAKGNGTSDALWDGTNLFVAAFDSVTSKIYKLSYDNVAKNYTVLPGFPVSMTMRKTAKSLVLEKDSTGRLWATYQGEGQIWVTYTTTADHKTWSAVQSIGTGTKLYDTSTVVAFGGNIGVAWTDEIGQRLCFRMRKDTDAANAWQPLQVLRSGFGTIDNHINAKVDPSGRVFMVLKDYYNHIWLARRNLDATWTIVTGVNGIDCGTRPILQLDPSLNKMYMFCTQWEVCTSLGYHAIEMRESDMDNMLFSLPTKVVAAPNIAMNDVSGSKQPVPPGCMLMMCAGFGKTYWMGWGSVSNIGGSDPGGSLPPPPAPPAGLIAQTVIEAPATSKLLLRMDEGTGTTTKDLSGQNHSCSLTGVLNQKPIWAPGLINKGLYFNGDSYISVGGSSMVLSGTSFTLETWVQLDSKSNNNGSGSIIAKADSNVSNYSLDLTAGTTLEFHWATTDTTGVGVKVTGPFKDGAWHHIAGVYDKTKGQARVYIDGHLTGSKTVPGPSIDKGWPMTIGAYKKGKTLGGSFIGSLDLLRISAAALYTNDFSPPILYPAAPTRYARLSWTPPTTPAGITSYMIDRGCNGYAASGVGSSIGRTPWFADLTPKDGTLTYNVHAVDGLNQDGARAYADMSYESSPPLKPTAPLALASIQTTATIDGPAFYEMNETSGSTSDDGTGLDHGMQLGESAAGDAAEPARIDGVEGKALRFDGKKLYALILDRNDVRFPGSFTLETWLRRNQLGVQQALVTKDFGPNKRNYGLLILPNGMLEFSATITGAVAKLSKVTSTVGITDSQWHHVACIYDGTLGTAAFWVDGAPAGSGAMTGKLYTGAEPILLGARSTGAGAGSAFYTDWLNGDLDLLRFSNRVVYSGSFTPPRLLRGGARHHIVRINWGMPTQGAVTTYKVYRELMGAGNRTLLATTPLLSPTILDNAIPPGSYLYTVSAMNSANVEGDFSAPLQVDLSAPTDAPDPAAPASKRPSLSVYPNPFNPQAIVSFRLEQSGPVELTLYDSRGRRVEALLHGVMPAGEHRVPLLRSDTHQHLASGIYFLRLHADGRDTRRKVVLLQ